MTDIKVTPADRAAAEGLHAISEVRNSIIEKAFARHRIEAQRPLIEALEAIITIEDSFTPVTREHGRVLEKARAAIQQAKGE